MVELKSIYGMLNFPSYPDHGPWVALDINKYTLREIYKIEYDYVMRASGFTVSSVMGDHFYDGQPAEEVGTYTAGVYGEFLERMQEVRSRDVDTNTTDPTLGDCLVRYDASDLPAKNVEGRDLEHMLLGEMKENTMLVEETIYMLSETLGYTYKENHYYFFMEGVLISVVDPEVHTSILSSDDVRNSGGAFFLSGYNRNQVLGYLCLAMMHRKKVSERVALKRIKDFVLTWTVGLDIVKTVTKWCDNRMELYDTIVDRGLGEWISLNRGFAYRHKGLVYERIVTRLKSGKDRKVEMDDYMLLIVWVEGMRVDRAASRLMDIVGKAVRDGKLYERVFVEVAKYAVGEYGAK